MTLVSAYWEEDNPTLIGDLLISSTTKPSVPMHIPSVGFTDNLYDPEYCIFNAGMTRKLHMFSGQLAVGCAGNAIAAKTVYQDISDNFSTEYFHREKLFDFVNNLNYVGDLDLCIVGIFTDLEGCFTFKWHSAFPKKLHIEGNYSEGSGKLHFEEILRCPVKKNGDLNHDISPLIEGLKKAAILYGDEQIKGDPLQSYFGGGFEVIGYHDGRLKFISDVAYICWVINFKDGKIKDYIFKKNIVQHTYRDDILWICSNVFRGSDADSRYQDKWRTELYALQPIHGKHTRETIKKISLKEFSSKTICNYFHVNDIDNNREYAVVDIALSPKTEFLNFESSGSGVSITVEGSYLDRLNEMIKEIITKGST